MILKLKLLLITLAFLSSQQLFSNSQDPNTPRIAMGKGLYSQSGANSCVYCHGVNGVGGKVKDAANLNTPKAWKIYKILGGDAAFSANADEFKKRFKEATVHLMLKGALLHNNIFKKDWFSLAATGPYNAQMLGMSAGPSKAWFKKYQKKYGIKKETAAESLYLYLKTIDAQKIL